jgi:hypothetical protein
VVCSASYVGCNTWDLMDKARYPEYHDEIQNRLDSMVKVRFPIPLPSLFHKEDQYPLPAKGVQPRC